VIAFVGLGNIGSHYANTKHNFGFWVVDEFAHRQHLSFQPGKGDYVYAESSEKDVLLVKPTTGMNASGIAIKHFLGLFDINLKDLNVFLDDVDLPLGRLRIRPKGGDGCHRGLESIIYHIGNTHFPRVRIGVASTDHRRPAEQYVLKPFRKQDRPLAQEMIQVAADAAESLLYEGLDKTMNQYNSSEKIES
jgi:PTH1 family peptidyl-tRNA hydrolase